MLILMGLFVIGYVSAQSGVGINPLGWLILGPANLLIRIVLAVTGQGG
jgi:hypothetical protein